jgi:hypothetical protein
VSKLKNTARTTSDEYVAHWRALAAYVTGWDELIAAASDPGTLHERWNAERDRRDALELPVVVRLDLLRRIAPEEVRPTASLHGANDERAHH